MLRLVSSSVFAYMSTSFNDTCVQPLINTSVCRTVLQSYNASGCGESCFVPPGWGGKLCTSVTKLISTTPPTYTGFGILFSDDGSTFTYRMTTGSSRSEMIAGQFNWSIYTTLLFEDYQTFKSYDNAYVTIGLPQVGSSGSSALVNAGFHNTGMYFTPDFVTMYVIVGFDFLTDRALRDMVAPFYPPNYFGTYEGPSWIKDPFLFTENGNVDEDANTVPYFTCATHSPEIPPPASFSPIYSAPVCDGVHTLNADGVYTCYSTVNGGDPCFLFETPSFVCLQLVAPATAQKWWTQ